MLMIYFSVSAKMPPVLACYFSPNDIADWLTDICYMTLGQPLLKSMEEVSHILEHSTVHI